MILQGAVLRKAARDEAHRRLLHALAASAAAHMLVLWPASLPHEPLKLAQPLVATLRERPPLVDGYVAPHKARAAPAAKSPQRAHPARRARRAEAGPILQARAPLPERQPRTEPQAAAEAAEVPSATAERESITAATITPGLNEGAATQAIATENEVGADANALRQYRFAVSRAARTDYPRLAVERGWTGTAQVRLAIDGNGRLRRVSLAGSSGHAVLDAKAQTIIGRAAEATPLPLALLGHAFSVDLPVEFRLEGSIAHR